VFPVVPACLVGTLLRDGAPAQPARLPWRQV
jgi:hypothetical protein